MAVIGRPLGELLGGGAGFTANVQTPQRDTTIATRPAAQPVVRPVVVAAPRYAASRPVATTRTTRRGTRY